MNIRFLILLLISLIIAACQEERIVQDVNLTNSVLDLGPEETRVDFRNDIFYTPSLNIIEYLYFNNGGGVAVGDIDNDGLEDLCFTSNQGIDKLYKNLGDLKFKDITEEAGLRMDSTWSTGVAIDDINNDGYKDIYISKVDHAESKSVHNLLYINQGDGTFVEESKKYGLDFSGYSTQITFVDIDLDGDLDAYLLNHSIHSTESYGSTKKRETVSQESGDRLYENRVSQGDPIFRDITSKSGIYSSALGYGLGVVAADVNGDGFPDIYVGNDFHENDYLYINQGDKTFKESIATYTSHTSQFTMGVDAADINNDGMVDLFTTDMMPNDPEIFLKSGGNDTEQLKKVKDNLGFGLQYSRNHLYVNSSNNQFSEQANITKTFATDWSWSVLMQDFDNNGLTDIFISNGIINRPNDLDYINYINTPKNRQQENESNDDFNKRLIDQMPSLKLENILFRQEEDLTFSDVGSSKIGKPNYSHGSAYADLDNNGTLEIISNNVNAPASIISFENGNNFIGVKLKSASDQTVKGAKVFLHTGEESQMREYSTTRGFQSSSTHNIHFGIGENKQVDSITVVWNNSKRSVINDPKVNTYHEIGIQNATAIHLPGISDSDQHFKVVPLPIVHQENEFDDLDSEPLMHAKYSSKGPALLVHDFDKDGFKDIFLGGSRGNAAQLFNGTASSKFKKKEVAVFDTDARYEDIDASLIDFNKDGLQDLYVVSGGNDKNQLDESLQDRIYFNDGKGDFLRLPLSLPHMNGSTVAVHDYDNDGYEDMFVGASNIPGAYGVSPISFMIKNENGGAVSIVHKDKMGMISDAQWIDLDSDGTKELCAVGEWTTPKVLESKNDTTVINLEDRLFPELLNGLYRSIDFGDINRDGKPDLLLGNQGYNTALQNEEVELYLDDFDNNSFIDPIILRSYFGNMIPLSSKDQLQKQIPSIKKVFPDFNSYSMISGIEELVAKSTANIKKSLVVDELGSYILMSSKDGFERLMLPREAQLSAINKMLWMPELYGGSLLVCGNENSASHALGNSTANAASLFSGYDDKEKIFTRITKIKLPSGTVVRDACMYDPSSVIIGTNDGPLYLLQFESPD